VTAAPFPSLDITYHRLINIIAGVTTILCVIFSLGVSLGYLLKWVNPQEQKQQDFSDFGNNQNASA
jgi:hypothetical protein